MSLLAIVALFTAFQEPEADLKKYVYPRSAAILCPVIETDVSDFPESEAWANVAKGVVESWYGEVTSLLATDGRDPVTGEANGRPFQSPAKVRLVFKKEISAPAWASGGEITVSGKWITEHPEDLGMMVHELAHVVQQYPKNEVNTGWLVEGIADYIRWWRYEPELHATAGRTKPDFTKAKYTDAYRTTAVWLAWVTKKHDARIVPCLDFELRRGKDPMPRFKALTGKTAQELWDEFAKESS